MRHNEVTGMLICFVMAMSSFSSRMYSQNTGSGVFIVTEIMSTTQATMMGIIFKLFVEYYRWNKDTVLYMLVDEKNAESVERFTRKMKCVRICNTLDCETLINQVWSTMDEMSEMTVLTMNTKIFRLCEGLVENNLSVHMMMDITNFGDVSWCFEKAKSCKCVLHPVPMTDASITRYLVSTTLTESMFGLSMPLCTSNMKNVMGHYRYYDTMIKYMNIEGMCYDCWICSKISKAMIPVLASDNEETQENIMKNHEQACGDMEKFELKVLIEESDPEVEQ